MQQVDEATARRRWLTIAAIRIAGGLGAAFGVVLLSRAPHWGIKVLAIAIVLSALYMMATVPLALAHRWRSADAPTPRSWKRRR